MAKNIARLVTRQIKDIREWVPTRQLFVELDLKNLDERLSEESLQGLAVAANALTRLGNYYGNRGILESLAGNTTGYSDINRSISYYYRAIKIRREAFFRRLFLRPIQSIGSLTREVSIAASLLCYAIVADDAAIAASMAELLISASKTPGAIADYYIKGWQFEPFALRLYQKLFPVELPVRLLEKKLGPYESVFSAWDGTLSEELPLICDRHVHNMYDHGGDWRPEFIDSPFDLVPLEIMAIRAVRSRLGLKTADIAHPLLATGLDKIDFSGIPADDLLIRVDGQFKELFGSNN